MHITTFESRTVGAICDDRLHPPTDALSLGGRADVALIIHTHTPGQRTGQLLFGSNKLRTFLVSYLSSPTTFIYESLAKAGSAMHKLLDSIRTDRLVRSRNYPKPHKQQVDCCCCCRGHFDDTTVFRFGCRIVWTILGHLLSSIRL